MLSAWVNDELIYRRGVALGLDENDSIIRQRIIQKTKYLFRNLAIIDEPSEQELRDWYAQRSEIYRKPPRYSFEQILVRDPSAQGQESIQTILKQIQSGKSPQEFISQYHAFNERDRIGLEVSFGKVFVDRLDLLKRSEWAILQSKKGWHLLRMKKVVRSPQPSFKEIRPLLITEWKKQQQRLEEQKLVDKLKVQYDIKQSSST
jgi:hypothetical protein